MASDRPAPQRWFRWRDVFIALGLVAGLSGVFFGPIISAVSTQPADQGRILGETVITAMTIPVWVVANGSTDRLMSRPASGLLLEALAQAAADKHSQLSYTNRGAGVYLSSFMGQPNIPPARWQVQINNIIVTDLSQQYLQPNDEVTITYLTR